jgi:hypothetical protein
MAQSCREAKTYNDGPSSKDDSNHSSYNRISCAHDDVVMGREVARRESRVNRLTGWQVVGERSERGERG